MGLIKKYMDLDTLSKTKVTTIISIIINITLAIGKFILAIFKGIFFFIGGCINIFFFISKLECYKGIRRNDNFSFNNKVVSILLILSGLLYAIYMGSILFIPREMMEYSDYLAISIALIAFIEMGSAIYGLINQKKHGHYYRNLKIINFSATLISMMWAMLALLIYCKADYKLVCGIVGLLVGIVIIILGIYLLFAPKISIVDREYSEYELNDDFKKESPIVLSNSFIIGDYYYEFIIENNVIKGHIKKGKNFWSKINIYYKIFICVLSEILIFVYFIIMLVYFFKTLNLPGKLEELMKEYGCKKIN